MDTPPWTLSHTLLRALGFILAVMDSRPYRVVDVFPTQRKPLIIATDAGKEGTSGTLAYVGWDAETNESFGGYTLATPDVYASWNHSVKYIGNLETAIVLGAVVQEKERLRHRMAYTASSTTRRRCARM